MRSKPYAIIDTWVVYCGHNLDQLRKLPEACLHLIYIDLPFNSNRNYEGRSPTGIFGARRRRNAASKTHEPTRSTLATMRPRVVELHRVLTKTGSFYDRCDCHAQPLRQRDTHKIFGEY